MSTLVRTHLRVALAVLGASLLSGCFESPPMETVQRGYRGTGMEYVVSPKHIEEMVAKNHAPGTQPALPGPGPKSSELYKNVQVLGDTSAGELAGLMVAITEWVSPEQGCSYCHTADMASDDLYTKRISRTMIQMTQNLNENWSDHVGSTGVTCYTCHRGKNVPEFVWATDPGPKHAKRIADPGQNTVSLVAAHSSLPYDPLTPFLAQDNTIRVASRNALPMDNRTSIKQTEWTYSLMMHFSDSLGVGCVHCHNSRAFASWEESPPTRLKAWHGINMTRELNNEFITPTESYLRANRKGPLGDPLKANCKTCHQGAYKPMFGTSMIGDFPGLAALQMPPAEPQPLAEDMPATEENMAAEAASDDVATEEAQAE